MKQRDFEFWLRIKFTRLFPLIVIAIGSLSPVLAQVASNRYALILEDPPVSARFESRAGIQSAEAKSYQKQIVSRQKAVRDALASKKIQVTASASTLLNAVFVVAPKDRVAELKSIPGVKAAVPVRWYHTNLNRAVQLMNAPAAWSVSGGTSNAGSGIKIAILDSGIDQNHPAFQDPSLPMPAGYPICNGDDCNYTNNKVIVARSYVRQLAAGSSMDNPAADSRPDDYSPRDRVGHGTAVASCAAGITDSGAVTITGLAPKAYLGNYKIYGSPEVNDGASDDVIIHALEDAMNDGMDVVSFSSGGPAFTGPLDSGAVCGNDPGVPCDLSAQAFETAAKAGMIIVAAAGNDGAPNSIESPGDAPSVIAVGATTNSHTFSGTVSVAGASSNLQNLSTQSGDAYVPFGSMTAPLVDITQLGNDGFACTALPGQSLVGAIALIARNPGTNACRFATQLSNVYSAGAIGAIFYMSSPTSSTVGPSGLSGSPIPAVSISNGDGLALKNYIDSNSGRMVTIDPNGIEIGAIGNLLAGFSSIGPSVGNAAIKPDLVAVGTDVYMAGESYDPLGPLYSSDSYVAADGTSFSTPIVSGAAALVKQNHPNFTPAQVKSALVNTATQDVTTDDQGNPVDVRWLGGGKLDAGAAARTTVTSNPVSVSFGIITSLPKTRQFEITNSGSGTVSLSLAVTSLNGTKPSLDKQSLSLAPNATGAVTVTLSGSMPRAGSYSGAVTVQGPGVSLRIPYLYLVGSGIPSMMIPLAGDQNDGTVGQVVPDGMIAFKLVDNNGVPVAGAPVSWAARNGGPITNADSVTDGNGIAAAQAVLGSQPGTYAFTAVAGGMRYTFTDSARPQPVISSIANAASFDTTKPVAPGSYITIFGSGVSDTTDYGTTATLPLAIDYVHVSFDVPSAGISVPGRLIYVSPNQINLQVPWELKGQASVQVKVTIDQSYGNVVTLPLADYAPAFFETSPGVVAALDSNFAVVGSANPARRGQVVQLFANGLGPVANQPASGDPAPSGPLATTAATPVVMIGEEQAPVLFSGLAPGFPALYQINVSVPSNLAPGNYPISVAIGGQVSKYSGILVQ